MIVARWQIEAKFGHKQTVIDMLKIWTKEFGSQAGWAAHKVRTLTGSIGAPESLVISEVTLESLDELGAAFEKLATLPGHAEWGTRLEPYVVSGSNRWEVLRIV